MANKKQLSFAGGELAPALHARTDQIKYTTGAKKLLNTFVLRHGGTANRPGTQFVSPTSIPERKSRLIPFVFNLDQSYALEFGHLHIKVVKNGTYITDASKAISNIEATAGSPYVVQITSHGYSTGDQVYIEDVVGIESLNGKYYTITVLDVNRFELDDTTAAGGGTAFTHEDLTDSSWIETDTGAKMVVSGGPPSKADLTTNRHVPAVSLHKDFGADYFDGNYIIDWTTRVNGTFASYAVLGFPTLHNLSGGAGDGWDIYQDGDQEGGIWFHDGTPGLHARIYVRHNSILTELRTYGVSLNTDYYMRMERDEDASPYGDIIWSIYPTDADRTNDTNLIYRQSTSITAAQGKKDWRYMTATYGWADQPGTWACTGWVSDVRHTNNPGDPGDGDTYTSGGTAERVYSFATGYPEEDLFTLEYTQSADVLTITHPHHPIKDVTRLADDDWSINTQSFAATIATPANLASDASGTAFYYKVTAVDAETNEESLPTAEIGSSTETSNLSWDTVTGAGMYNIYKKLNGVFGFIGVAGAEASPTFKCDSYLADTTDTPPEDRQPFALGDADNITAISQADPCVVTIGAHTYVVGDHIWIEGITGMTELNNLLFYVSAVTATTVALADPHTFVDIDSTAYTAWASGGTVQEANNFPATSTYYQQRMMYGFQRNNTEGIWGSKSGLRKNMMVSTPLQDDDAVTFSIVGRQVNAVKHLLDVGELVVFTASGEWIIQGDGAGILTPSAINPKQQTANGCSDLAPLVVDGNAIYVQARGSIIRDLGYEYESNGYRGSELSIFAAHLFDNYTLVDWAYQQTPHSIVWAVRDDGTLLGMTYIREQQINAWHQHTFGGGVESVCVIPEAGRDVLYMVVKRTIQGVVHRYIEKLTPRPIDDIVDAVFMDSSLSYDGRHTGSTTMTLSGGSLWLYEEEMTLTASAAAFFTTDVGNQYWLTVGTETLRCTVTAYTSDTIVTVRPHMTVPSVMRDSVISTWARAVDQLSGLDHLEGEDVSVFADGFVVANPNNSAYDVLTVSGGSITLEKPYTVIHVGLPYISDLETLRMDNAEGASLADKRKNVSSLTVFLEDSRGGWVGPNEDALNEFKQRSDEGYSDPIALRSGTQEIAMQPEWNAEGGILIRQTDPLPLSVLAVVPSGYLAATTKR